ncbi:MULTISPECIES: hypothetical protein [unclassified Caballeronia]|uniref:hypothetical protein n=1 Tax=unclassified Caballeronia TaxID=2646786 RepID=UPI0028657573|nr:MULTISPECIES: hypothetical protein [unclassified Caballeronia]MDR5738345.1 hypothetical protein [Caballeronia sp. LZ016]MDR5811799.1 hypothetical protein [Caballeronia sp. LZ019]
MKIKRFIGLGIVACAGLACEAATAGVSIGVNLGIPVAPVYAAPPPVYVQPQPVYVQPQPAYVEQQPAYVEQPGPPPVAYQAAPPAVYPPAPVIVAPAPAVVIGWHGDRYWDGARYWDRRDWRAHHGGYGYRHW